MFRKICMVGVAFSFLCWTSSVGAMNTLKPMERIPRSSDPSMDFVVRVLSYDITMEIISTLSGWATGQLVWKKKLSSNKYAYIVLTAAHAVEYAAKLSLHDPTFGEAHVISQKCMEGDQGKILFEKSFGISFTQDQKLCNADAALLYVESTRDYPIAKLAAQMPKKGTGVCATGYYVDDKNKLQLKNICMNISVVLKESFFPDLSDAGKTIGWATDVHKGMSGGPLYDRKTKQVYGVIRMKTDRATERARILSRAGCEKSFFTLQIAYVNDDMKLLIACSFQYSWAVSTAAVCTIWKFLPCVKSTSKATVAKPRTQRR